MTTVDRRLITAEEFWMLPDHGGHSELARGEVRVGSVPDVIHGLIVACLGSHVEQWAESNSHGFAGISSGFVLQRSPDTVRGPDVYFIRADRMPAGLVPNGFVNFAHDLAIEVVSASESAEDVREKVRDYLTAGSPLVWVVYPRTCEVVVHSTDGLARTFGKGEALTSAEVLPGFSLPVSAIFEDLPS